MALHPKRLNFQNKKHSLLTATTPSPQKSNFSNWHIPSSNNGQTNPELIFFNEALILCRWSYGHKTKYWSTGNPHLMPESLSHKAKLHIWHIM
jgi:hypothetical protein